MLTVSLNTRWGVHLWVAKYPGVEEVSDCPLKACAAALARAIEARRAGVKA